MQESTITIIDSDTGNVLYYTAYLPIVFFVKGRQLEMTTYTGDQKLSEIFYIDDVDRTTNKVFVSLQKVYLNNVETKLS